MNNFPKSIEVGRGISGVVVLYPRKRYVVKKYHTRDPYETRAEFKARVLHEFRVLHSLLHPNVIKALRHKVSITGVVSVVLEAGTRDLLQLLKKAGGASQLPRGEVLCLWRQVCCGVEYLHLQGVAHRDLKLENLVLDWDTDVVKIIDFVTATSEGGGEPSTKPLQAAGLVGSPRYAAPETAARILYEAKPVDLWALGILLHYFVTGRFPWKQAVHLDSDYVNFERDTACITQNSDCPAYVVSLLNGDPLQRPDIAQLVGDPWVKQIGSCSDGGCGCEHVLRSLAGK